MCGNVFQTKDRRAKCWPCRRKTQLSFISTCPTCGAAKEPKSAQCAACRWGPSPILKHLSQHDLGWLVGIIEGEGTFTNRLNGALRVQMTDRDVVYRIADMTGVGRVISTPSRSSKHKDSWAWTVKRADNLSDVLKMIAPHLSSRRQVALMKLKAADGVALKTDAPASDDFNLGWARGYLEGEGSFFVVTNSAGRNAFHITATSVDIEPIKKLKDMFGGNIIVRDRKPEVWTPNHIWSLRAKNQIAGALTAFDGHMGHRRNLAIKTMIAAL